MMAEPMSVDTGTNTKKRWYIVHAHSGMEKKVAQQILEQARQKGLEDKFGDVLVPIENYVEVKKGKKTNSERRFFPGYVLVSMEMNDATWQVVKNTPKVTGFLGGGGNRPQPISQREVDHIMQQIQEGMESPKHSVKFTVGDSVKIVDGPFESFVGMVEEVDEDKNKLKIAVSIFGRSTPVELDFGQVERN